MDLIFIYTNSLQNTNRVSFSTIEVSKVEIIFTIATIKSNDINIGVGFFAIQSMKIYFYLNRRPN